MVRVRAQAPARGRDTCIVPAGTSSRRRLARAVRRLRLGDGRDRVAVTTCASGIQVVVGSCGWQGGGGVYVGLVDAGVDGV